MIVAGTGGASAGTGGAGTGGAVVGTGGAATSGGATGSGGRASTGGATASGGAPTASGGATGSGGRASAGGAPATGGSPASGGAPATGGRVGTGGAPATGGSTGTGSVFNDDFESGASKWIATAPASDWSVVTDGGSMVYKEGAPSTNAWRGSAAGDSAWTNITVEARVKVLAFNGSSSSYLVGVCARVKDASNRYCIGLRSDGKMAIRKTIAGSGSSSAAINVGSGIVANTWYTARIKVVGSAITGTLLLNGMELGVATDTDATIATGGIQVGTQNATAEFDDVKVTAP